MLAMFVAMAVLAVLYAMLYTAVRAWPKARASGVAVRGLFLRDPQSRQRTWCISWWWWLFGLIYKN